MRTQALILLTIVGTLLSFWASAENVIDYVNRRAPGVCASGIKITTADLGAMLKNSAPGMCNLYRFVRFDSPSEAQTTTYDGYNGPIYIVDLILDNGPSGNLQALHVSLRDIPLCVSVDGNKTSIVYDLKSSAPPAYESVIKNYLYTTFIRQSSELDRTVLLEFEAGQLKFVGYKNIDDDGYGVSGGGSYCGKAGYLKN